MVYRRVSVHFFIKDNEMTDRYLLVAVATGDEDTTWKSLEELALLLETAGGETAESFVQNLAHPDPATYVGSGKARELKEMVDAFELMKYVQSLSDEESAIVEKGLNLFCKYFRYLWD